MEWNSDTRCKLVGAEVVLRKGRHKSLPVVWYETSGRAAISRDKKQNSGSGAGTCEWEWGLTADRHEEAFRVMEMFWNWRDGCTVV